LRFHGSDAPTVAFFWSQGDVYTASPPILDAAFKVFDFSVFGTTAPYEAAQVINGGEVVEARLAADRELPIGVYKMNRPCAAGVLEI
jgi:hypothetical protein